jgi:hypothetical protein
LYSIGIISNLGLFIPLAYALAVQKLHVHIFLSQGGGSFAL